MSKLGQVVIEGKSKKFYELDNGNLFMVFKPHLRSVTSQRESNIEGTDLERLEANRIIMDKLINQGIKTHLVDDKTKAIGGMTGLEVIRTTTIPIEFICRYYAAGSIVRLYPSIVKPNMKFKQPLFKYDLKQDVSVAGVDDPTLNESYITGLGLLTERQFSKSKRMLEDIGYTVCKLLDEADMTLIDMKMEFGFNSDGEIILIDEISQDCIRANDKFDWEPMTKDAYRNMKSDEEVLEKYKEFNQRIRSV